MSVCHSDPSADYTENEQSESIENGWVYIVSVFQSRLDPKMSENENGIFVAIASWKLVKRYSQENTRVGDKYTHFWPASMSNTVVFGSSESLAASTQPAVPASTPISPALELKDVI